MIHISDKIYYDNVQAIHNKYRALLLFVHMSECTLNVSFSCALIHLSQNKNATFYAC